MDPAGVVVADGTEHPLRHALSIGRDAGNDIVLAKTTVSRQHAVLAFVEGRWLIEDRGSANGTFVNGERVPFGSAHPLRHGDRIGIGAASLVFSWPAEGDDPERTDEHEALPPGAALLSPFQLQVVRALCGAWVSGETVDALPSNEQIATTLGTPAAAGSVKAAPAGLPEGRAHTPPSARQAPRALPRRAGSRLALRGRTVTPVTS